MSDPSPTSATPDVGSTLGGKYRVVRRIGEGGMGVVVEAENLVTGKRVAIKWMHPQVAARPEAAERFLREARASARVQHPNVVDVYDAVHEGETCFLVMELLEGEPLSYLLERGGMPAHALIALLLDAMRGVAAAHRKGVIHRDIKPDNIFLAREPDRVFQTPKVLDFGISKVTGSEVLSLTRTGATMGTPLYMSYEQLCGVKDIDPRTDVYAFGVILYEALTGQPPYHAESFPELIVKITNSQPPPPKQLRPDIPSSLDRLVQRAMAKERSERIGSLEQLIEALEPFANANGFRAQMTADGATLPRVIARSDEPSKPSEPSLVVEGRESFPIATPMEASVPIPAAPRKRDALAWLAVGGALATLLGALTLFGTTPQPEAAQSPSATPPAANSGAPPAAPAQPSSEPERKSEPEHEPEHAAEQKPRVPRERERERERTTRPEPPHQPETREPAAATEAAAPTATPPSRSSRLLRAPTSRGPQPPSAASTHIPNATERATPAPPPDLHRFRAGRPRSQDF